MEAKESTFNRILLIVLAVLFAATLFVFSYTQIATDPGNSQWWMVLLNTLIVSIPLGLLFGSIYILVVAWREHTRHGQVSPRLAKVIHWAPRLAAILIILFVSLFSFDVFEMDAPPLQVLGAFILHNIPSIVMIVLLVFAWKRPVVGFGFFIIAAAFLAIFFVRDIYALSNLLLVVLPILLVAFLFYVDWKWLTPQPPAQADTVAPV